MPGHEAPTPTASYAPADEATKPSSPASGGSVDAAGPAEAEDDLALLAETRQTGEAVRRAVGEVIVGHRETVDHLLTAVYAGGHVLILGVPGLAKTLLISTLARSFELEYRRIQFTPDLMPSDITGAELLRDDGDAGGRGFGFVPGPIFANMVLADEINRSPPKTQAALLEAMGERRVTAMGEARAIAEPFFVMATQNPLDHEGTYPLPEAQLDRFLCCLQVDYPGRAEEIEIIHRATGRAGAPGGTIVSRDRLLAGQALARRVPVARHLMTYAARLVRATRPESPEAPDFVREWVAYGAGPRAGAHVVAAARARAALRGRAFVSVDDVEAVCLPVLRHRVIPSFAARSTGVGADDVLLKLLRTVPADERLYRWPPADGQSGRAGSAD